MPYMTRHVSKIRTKPANRIGRYQISYVVTASDDLSCRVGAVTVCVYRYVSTISVDPLSQSLILAPSKILNIQSSQSSYAPAYRTISPAIKKTTNECHVTCTLRQITDTTGTSEEILCSQKIRSLSFKSGYVREHSDAGALINMIRVITYTGSCCK